MEQGAFHNRTCGSPLGFRGYCARLSCGLATRVAVEATTVAGSDVSPPST